MGQTNIGPIGVLLRIRKLQRNLIQAKTLDYSSPSWRHHKPGDEHNKFVEHYKKKKATVVQLAAVESNTVVGIAVTEGVKIPAIIPHKATTTSWAGPMSVMDN
eukprot:4002190-Ditylum_brightwellii.AAC.1